jgi:enamine deaminase RidA (YjgF/YER057c/UK114 family)
VVLQSGQSAADTWSEWGRTYGGQAEQVLAQIERSLDAAGSSKRHLAALTVYLRDVDFGLPEFRRVRRPFFTQTRMPLHRTKYFELQAKESSGIHLRLVGDLPKPL